MKIGLISPYDPAHPGGVYEHINHLRGEFVRGGHDVTILAPRGRKGGLEAREGFYGIGRTVPIPANGSMVRVTFDVTLYNAVKTLLRREQFDIIHLHEPLIPVLPYLVLLNSQTVNVGTFHAFRSSSPWYTAFKPYMSFMMSRLDARIAVSPPARDFVSQYFQGPYDIIPNGIDVARFQDIEPFPWANDGTPRILFVGRFNEPRKGLKYLLRALPLVQQQFPDARLVVVGRGDPEKLAGLMERYDVRGVDFVGQASAADLPRYYASCDVFCAPSTSGESFGIVLLEAMAAGAPVVAGDIPGYRSVIRHGVDGLLATPKNPQALALTLVRMLADGELRRSLTVAGLETAQRYDWPQIAQRVLQVYDRALGTVEPPAIRLAGVGA
ncbi:MAG: glycosyltransferase family 4 protein [Thermomicrobiales bacterium]|nr:glycosyltransferase family 4 protein [Thermomicrobiales bacterium]